MSDLRFSNHDRFSSSSVDYYETRFDRIRKSRFFSMGMAALSIAAFASVVIYAYNEGKTINSSSGDTPVITASNEPFKVRPDNAGGAEIAYRDSEAYKQMNDVEPAAGGEVENLLPPPEKALDKPVADMTTNELSKQAKEMLKTSQAQEYAKASEAFEDPSASRLAEIKKNQENNTTVASADKLENIAPAAGDETAEPKAADDNAAAAAVLANAVSSAKTAAPADRNPIISDEEAADKAASAAAAAKEDGIKIAAVQTAVSAATAEKAAAAAENKPDLDKKSAAAAGVWRIQLASFKDKAAAKAAWADMKKKYAPNLDNATMGITSADLGAKGIYYRLNAVNYSKDAATDVCNAIKAIKPQGCIVAK